MGIAQQQTGTAAQLAPTTSVKDKPLPAKTRASLGQGSNLLATSSPQAHAIMPTPVSTAAQVVEAEIASAIAKSQAAVWVPGTVVPFPEPQAEAQLKPAVRAAPPAWDRVVAASAEAAPAEVEAVAGEDGDSVATT
jgi:hypothetical protein